jgi:sigma-B regulation protein RsbU (phosphoserine phosphatase)
LRILFNEALAANPGLSAIAVCKDVRFARVSRLFARRVRRWPDSPYDTYAERVASAARERPGLLVVDQLSKDTARATFAAAADGICVLTQLDTVFYGAAIWRHLLDLGLSDDDVGALSWVVAVQRLSMLCPVCKTPVAVEEEQLAHLSRTHPHMADQIRGGAFYDARGCPSCAQTGRKGSVAAFDIYHAGRRSHTAPHAPSVLPLSDYVLGLALRGHLSVGDVLDLSAQQLHRTYALLTAEEQALSDANAALQRKLVELEAANRVLRQRTEALISLQDIGQALISTAGLPDLANKVCRHAGELCGAERAALYFRQDEATAKVLAVHGWSQSALGCQVPASEALATSVTGATPVPFVGPPPGVHGPRQHSALQAGLCVPLIAQGRQVGSMIVHTASKDRFAPGEVALLETFATQAALSIQRADLIEQLQLKVAQLEAAQVELVQKERMEHELELARQVQQSVLPRTFPPVPGYAFAAANRPARQVGGDFYDLFDLGGERFGLVVADVSGKGMPAALYMALARSLLLAEARRGASPREVLIQVHRLLTELGEPNMFVTVFYGVVERASGQMAYARAGHDRPILLRHGDALALPGQGACLGILDADQLCISEERLSLMPGDRLILYTDGLCDVVSPSGQLYGLDRLRELLLSQLDLGSGEMCDEVFAALGAYQGCAEQFDDMTLLVIDVARAGP